MARVKTTTEPIPVEKKGPVPVRVSQNGLQDIEKLEGSLWVDAFARDGARARAVGVAQFDGGLKPTVTH